MNHFRHFGWTPWMGDRPVARLGPTNDNTIQKNAYSYASVVIRTHDPSVRADQCYTCLRPARAS